MASAMSMRTNLTRIAKVVAAAYVGVWALAEPLSFLNLLPPVSPRLRIAYGLSVFAVAAILLIRSVLASRNRHLPSSPPDPRILFHVSGSAVSPSQKSYDVFNLGDEIFTPSLELLGHLPDVRVAVSHTIQVPHNGMFRISAHSTSESPLPELRVGLRFLDVQHQAKSQVFRIPADSSYAQPVAGGIQVIGGSTPAQFVAQNVQQSTTVNVNVAGGESTAHSPLPRPPKRDRTRTRPTSAKIAAARRQRFVLVTGLATILVAAMLLGYKQIGVSKLRVTLYQPLLADLERVKADVENVNFDDRATMKTFDSLNASGAAQRLPISIRTKLERISAQIPVVSSSAQALHEVVIPEISARIMTIRTEDSDRAWRTHAVEVLREASRPKKGVPDTVTMLAEISHEYIGRGRDSQMLVVSPGGPVFVLRDWLTYPASLTEIEGLWTDLDYLYFNGPFERWYYQFTRADLANLRVSLVQFLGPVHEALREHRAFRTLRDQRTGLLAEIADTEALLTERIRDPKHIRDLIPGAD